MTKKSLLILLPYLLLLTGCGKEEQKLQGSPLASTGEAMVPGVSVKVDNLSNQQTITENVPAQFRITASPDVSSVKVSANGQILGEAKAGPGRAPFHFNHTFTVRGDQDLRFDAYRKGDKAPAARATYRVQVVSGIPAGPSKLFNPYILRAVDYLDKNWGLLGYNINAQLTHPLQYHKYGVLKPTRDGQTMCVAGVLEVIITAFDIYSRESGNYALYDFLPFRSWNVLASDTIKGHIWVNPKLNSSGTADAVAKFGLGERVKFSELQPGGFINLNRTNGHGHAVVFLNYIDIKGNDLPAYSSKVAGFRYFGAQGKIAKGEGGLSYRHAFFSKNGCPEVPYKRDCDVIFSENQRVLNVGQMYHPSAWRHPSYTEISLEVGDREPLDPGEESIIHSPADFDGLTTDD